MKLSFETYKRFKTGITSSLRVDPANARGSTKIALEFFEKIIKPKEASEVVKNALDLWQEVRKKTND